MLIILVEIIMSVFIANFKAVEHPIINFIIRGFIIGLTCFLIGLFLSIVSGSDFSFIFALKVCSVVGLVGTIWVFLIEFIFGVKDKKSS
ncbi:hypothetical protein [Acinetobacter bereziniae]|uniref:hypothetical protein n=1 Tax=Acinetobacter bereziniae TaxID=106648 RepID=UPI0012507A7B|nr:hypothetical protein [Acinetobacter bereziniae]